jgi:hypothetical protein
VIWKDIPGFVGRYQVSERGDVRSVSRLVRSGRGERRHTGKLLKAVPDGRGYLVVNLSSDDGSRRTITWPVHKAVALAFHGPKPFEGAQIRHLDGNKDNCHKDNLRYGTRSENERDKIAHGRTNRGERSGASKLTDDQVSAIQVLLRDTTLTQNEIAALFGVAPSTVSRIRHGRHHFGKLAA